MRAARKAEMAARGAVVVVGVWLVPPYSTWSVCMLMARSRRSSDVDGLLTLGMFMQASLACCMCWSKTWQKGRIAAV